MISIGLTGATGMIGTNLLTQLGEDEQLRRRYRIVALVRPESRTEGLRRRGVELRTVDYRRVDSFEGALEDLEVVIHLAGLTKSHRRGEFRLVNTEGTRSLLSALSRYGHGVRHFLFTSSISACGPASSPESPKDEADPCTPVSRYGESKLEAEQAVQASGLAWTILRLPLVLGPHDYEGLRLLKLIAGRWLWTFGREADYLSYICAQDLGRVLLRMVLNEVFYREIVNVCYDGSAPAVELYARVRRLLGLDPRFKLHHLPRWTALAAGVLANGVHALRGKASPVCLDKARDLTAKNLIMTNEKLKRKLGLSSFQEAGALSETLNWFRERGLLLERRSTGRQ